MTEWTFSPVGNDKGRLLAEARGVTVTWLAADVVADILQPAAFDLVAVFYCSWHRSPAARRWPPGGTLLAVGHETANLTEGWGGPGDATVLSRPEDVVADIGGLEIVNAVRVERPVFADDGPQTAIDLLMRATRPA